MKIVFGPEQFDWTSPLVNFSAVLLGAALTWIASHQSEKRKHKEQNLGTAYSLIFKVQKFTNNLLQLENHVASAAAAAKQAGIKIPAWSMYSDIFGFTGMDEKLND